MVGSSTPNSLSITLGAKSSLTTDRTRELSKFLQFQLGGCDRALLEAEIVTEIIIVPENKIMPVPQMPYCVLGIYSWRSEMLWIVDLENRLGYPSSVTIANPKSNSTGNNLTLMVVQVKGNSLGLVVPNVMNIVQFDSQTINPSSIDLFGEVGFFLDGYFKDSNNDIIMLLNANKILQNL
ncbi:MAG: chemotaxis protein CheW [Prochloraceae cyanobacterium]|nr:chemotaxis protein CheW [Prochloraceae cyanobacterium]